MAGDQQLHALAEDQLIAHALAVAVASIHQDLQQIVAGGLLAPPPDVVEQKAEGAGSHFLVPAQFSRDGKPRIQVGLNGLANHKFLHGRDGNADEVDVLLFQSGAKQRPAYHREGNFHHEGIDIDRAEPGLSVEVPQRVGQGVLHDRGQNFQLLSLKTGLDEAPLCAPSLPFSGKKTLAQEVAHALHLNLGLAVVLRIRLQHLLNDDGIGGYDGLLDTAKIESEGVALERCVLRENLYRIAGHRARIQEGAKSGDGGAALRSDHGSLSRRLETRCAVACHTVRRAQQGTSYPATVSFAIFDRAAPRSWHPAAGAELCQIPRGLPEMDSLDIGINLNPGKSIFVP